MLRGAGKVERVESVAMVVAELHPLENLCREGKMEMQMAEMEIGMREIAIGIDTDTRREMEVDKKRQMESGREIDAAILVVTVTAINQEVEMVRLGMVGGNTELETETKLESDGLGLLLRLIHNNSVHLA